MPTAKATNRNWLPLLMALLCGVVAYCNSFSGPFIFDDIDSILRNPQVNHSLPAGSGIPPNTLAGRPILRMSFALNSAVGGMWLGGYHVTNLLIHLACGTLLFGIVRRNLLRREFWGERFDKSGDWLAGAVAAVWLVHPLNTEAVTYISQRAESLASVFYLAVIYCLIRAADENANSFRWQLTAIIACALGMATKEIVVTAPVVALFYDRTLLAGSFARALRVRGGLYLGLAATWVVLAALLTEGAHQQSVAYSSSLSVLDELRTQPGVVAHYLRLALWPKNLVIDYDDWQIVKHWTQLGFGAYLILAILLFSIIAFWKKPWLGFLGAWFLVILSPSSSVVPIFTEIAAEHRMYLPLMAPIALVVVGCWVLNKALSWVLVSCLLVVFSTLTLMRNDQYRDPVRLWSLTVAQRPNNARAWFNLGYSLLNSGHPADAVPKYAKALSLAPDYYAAARDLGRALIASGDPGAAEAYYTREMNTMPAFAPEALLQRSKLKRSRGDIAGADADVEAAAQLQTQIH